LDYRVSARADWIVDFETQMITSPTFRGKRYAVLGLARSGLATVRALVASGAEVIAWDSNAAAQDAVGAGVTLADPLEIDLTGLDGVVVSPGVPINRHPIAEKCRAAKVPLMGDIELFAQARASLPPHKVVGITGTNGKSTTTALVHHILKSAGVPTSMGGNIGLPILGQDPLSSGGVYVLELSSYQIDLTYSLDCDVAVILNITPDHLDRYNGFETYAASKGRLFEMQSDNSKAVVSTSTQTALNQVHKGSQCVALVDVKAYPAEQSAWPSLQGPHNLENAQVARVICEFLGVSEDVIVNALATYPGLPHRMERIRELGGVLYVNDSKGTNAEATAPALASYKRVHWILGGVAKTKELYVCAPYFPHVMAAYTIGEAGPDFAALLKEHMSVKECSTLDVAVQRAHDAAKPGDVVLLSPACASFDQFKDFEARGDAFRAYVEALV
jgi:UDP-N-acetylmuramoylalanine--D-glutamate ligase